MLQKELKKLNWLTNKIIDQLADQKASNGTEGYESLKLSLSCQLLTYPLWPLFSFFESHFGLEWIH